MAGRRITLAGAVLIGAMVLAAWVPFALWRQGREELPVALLQFVGGAIVGLVATYLTIRLPDAAALVVFVSLVVLSAVLLIEFGGAVPAGIGFGMGPAWLSTATRGEGLSRPRSRSRR